MRTETQKRIEELGGLKDSEVSFNSDTGKVVRTGMIHQEFEPVAIKDGLVQYKAQVSDLEKQVFQLKERLSAIGSVRETSELKRWLRMQKMANDLVAKSSVEENLKKREEELQFHKDTIAEQEELVRLYEDWLKKEVKK